MVVDPDIAEPVIDSPVAPTLADNEQGCRLAPPLVATRFLSGREGSNEALGEDAFRFFKGSGHRFDDFRTRENIALDRIIFAGQTSCPTMAIVTGKSGRFTIGTDDSYLARGVKGIVFGEKLDSLIGIEIGLQGEQSEGTVARVGE